MSRLFLFAAASAGQWKIQSISSVIGQSLSPASHLRIGPASELYSLESPAWVLQGIVSNERYITRDEKNQLLEVQEGLNRPASVCAALIPIKKTLAWWALSQDERRAIFEERSNHVRIGMKYLPPIARRLHHCRDISENEPFDFLTWFEYAPERETSFNELIADLRATEEWKYVDREVDIRLVR